MYKATPKLLLFIIVMLLFLIVDGFAQKSITKTVTKPLTTNPQNINTLSAIEQEIFDEINLIRSNPQPYIEILEEMKSGINQNVVKLPNGAKWKMSEGITALNDAINDLKKSPKLRPYKLSNGMTKAANLQLSDLKEDIKLGHFGKDGSDIEQRLNKFGMPGERFSENISYNAKDVRSAVLLMVIDDAFKSRNHRKNLLSTQFNQIGVAFGKGKNDVNICIIVFADNFIEMKK
jgi:uncharacterized protein YkwD